MMAYGREIAALTVCAGVLGSCTSGGGDPEPGGGLDCAEAELSAARVGAAQRVHIAQVAPGPEGFAVRLYTEVLDEPIEPIAFFDADEQRVEMLAPTTVETMDRETVYRVEYEALGEDGGAACEVGELAVEPLPEAGSYTVETLVEQLQASLDEARTRLGTSREALASLPEDDQLLFAPLIAAQYVVDHPDNPDSLVRIADGSAENLALSPDDRELLDRMLAARGGVIETIGGGISACGTGLASISTPEELACWVKVNKGVGATLASDTAEKVRAGIGYILAGAGLLTKGTALPYAALANFVLNQIIDGLENLTPSEVGQWTVELSDRNLCDTEMGTIDGVFLTAQSKGWNITVLTLIDGFLSVAGVPFGKASKVVGEGGEAATKLVRLKDSAELDSVGQDVLRMIRDAIVSFTGLYVDAGSIIQIPAIEFGPVELTQPDWYTVDSPDGRLDITETRYEAAAEATTGPAAMRFSLVSDALGLDGEHFETIHLRNFEIEVDNVYAKPEQRVNLVATVHCYEDPELFWTSPSGGGRMVDREGGIYEAPDCDRPLCPFPGDIRVNLVGPDAPSDTFSADVLVGQCCQEDPPTACTREERCDCEDPPSICTGPIAIRPEEECVQPGSELELRVWSDFGDTPDALEWSVRATDDGPAGHVDDEGRLSTPEREATVIVRAEAADDEANFAESTIEVSSECTRWVVRASPLRTFRGDVVDIPAPGGLSTDEGVQFPLMLLSSGGGPSGTIVLEGYPGRDERCRGPTGSFIGAVSAGERMRAAGGEALWVHVDRFDETSLSVRVEGWAEYVGPEAEDGVDVWIDGQVELAAGGCRTGDLPDPDDDDEDPAETGELLGSVQGSELCAEFYDGESVDAEAWSEGCAMSSDCMPEQPCPAEGRVGRCDLRAGGTGADMPQIQHYYDGGELSASDAMTYCSSQGGRWLDG